MSVSVRYLFFERKNIMQGRYKKSIFTKKRYRHFDNDPGFLLAREYLKSEDNIAKHAFYPFVLDEKKYEKFTKDKGRYPKIRPIMFSSHMDRYIYQWYNRKLNIKYNKYAKIHGINNCAVAYRYRCGKNNIHIARDVFNKIISMNESYIIVGDFKSFFDKLDHKYLKLMMSKLLNKDKLPKDLYAVYKNITKFAYFDIKDLCKFLNINKSEFYKSKEIIDRNILKSKKKKYMKVNRKEYGIPQGSSISSVLSNIYMLDCDKLINNYITSRYGLYKRYSDDFIIVVPNVNQQQFKDILCFIEEVFRLNGNPEPEKNKTKIFSFQNLKLQNVTNHFYSNMVNDKNELEYLGFTFDGINIKITDRTKSKFIHKMDQKIKTIAICHGVTKKGNKISGTELRRVYSKEGKDKGRGNFITYSERCDKIFKDMNNYSSFTKNCEILLKRRISKLRLRYKFTNPARYYIAINNKKQKGKKLS
jgi:hypothetical protein